MTLNNTPDKRSFHVVEKAEEEKKCNDSFCKNVIPVGETYLKKNTGEIYCSWFCAANNFTFKKRTHLHMIQNV